jgi:hypothetical protein
VEQRAFLQQIRSQVVAGQLTVDELAGRVQGRHLRGPLAVRTEPAGAPVEWSADGRAWHALGAAPLAEGRYPEWTEIPSEFAPEQPGVYWFCAVAADRAGNKAASEPMPVQVGVTL